MPVYIKRHAHRWVWTAAFVHGSRVGRCAICGDEAYEVEMIIRMQESHPRTGGH